MSFRLKFAAIIAGLALFGTACGGSATESILDTAAGDDISVDIDDEGNITLNEDGSEVSFGANVDVPDWIPNGFPLPADLNIQLAGSEADRSTLAAATSDNPATASAAILAWFSDNGYDVIREETSGARVLLTGVNSDGEVIDAVLGEIGEGAVAGTGDGDFTVEIDISHRDVSFEQQAAIEEVQSPGSATAIFDGERYVTEGTCTVRGSVYFFDGFDSETEVLITANLDPTIEPPTTFAFVQAIENGHAANYSASLAEGAPGFTYGYEEDGSGFSLDGPMENTLSFEPSQAVIEVTCQG